MNDAPSASGDRLSRSQRQQLKAQERGATDRHHRRGRLLRRTMRWGLFGLLAAGGLGWLGYSIATAKRLPPTSMADHLEESPPSHILSTPMPLKVQKHMLEHADGGGPPGVIINYNCVKFRCPEGTIERLAGIARAYPAFVYLAPYPEMDARIAVTRLGAILVLEEVEPARIHEFITGSTK